MAYLDLYKNLRVETERNKRGQKADSDQSERGSDIPPFSGLSRIEKAAPIQIVLGC